MVAQKEDLERKFSYYRNATFNFIEDPEHIREIRSRSFRKHFIEVPTPHITKGHGQPEHFKRNVGLFYLAHKAASKTTTSLDDPTFWMYADQHEDMRSQLVERNRNLVMKMIKRVASNKKVHDGDLRSAGNFMLFRALESFDPWHGIEFSTYACNGIGLGIKTVLRNNRTREKYVKLNAANRDMGREYEWHEGQEAHLHNDDTDENIRRIYEVLYNPAILTDIEKNVLIERYFNNKTLIDTAHAVGLTTHKGASVAEQRALNKLRPYFNVPLAE